MCDVSNVQQLIDIPIRGHLHESIGFYIDILTEIDFSQKSKSMIVNQLSILVHNR